MWLARDKTLYDSHSNSPIHFKETTNCDFISRAHRQVALKILKADASENNQELSMLLALSNSHLNHPGKAHVIELLDHFHHKGPNGNHLCLVLPVMISDGEGMTISGMPHSAGYVQMVSHQILLGLDFLHKSSIVHCGKSALYRSLMQSYAYPI